MELKVASFECLILPEIIRSEILRMLQDRIWCYLLYYLQLMCFILLLLRIDKQNHNYVTYLRRIF